MSQSQHTIFLVHGIFSNGAWHRTIARVVWPFFKCKSIRYREYHAFGPVNMFFWPWSLMFAGILGSVAMRRTTDATIGWIAVSVLASFGLVASYRSGFGRAIPWLLVSGFWLGAKPEAQTWLPLSLALILVALVGWLSTETSGRRKASALAWLVGILATISVWGISRCVMNVQEPLLLAACTIPCGLYLSEREINWSGWHIP